MFIWVLLEDFEHSEVMTFRDTLRWKSNTFKWEGESLPIMLRLIGNEEEGHPVPSDSLGWKYHSAIW